MRVKDTSVQCVFHPVLTAFLFKLDPLYQGWKAEVVITSGSEITAHHSFTSLHYATPCQAADIRSWEVGVVPPPVEQVVQIKHIAAIYCDEIGIPEGWIEIILESNHIHIEYQPKRQEGISQW